MWAIISLSFLSSFFPATGEVEVQQMFKDYIRQDVDLQPFWGTRLGDHRHASRLESLDPKAVAVRRQFHKETLVKLEELGKSSAGWSLAARVDLETWINHEKRWLWNFDFLQHLHTDPRVYNEYISDSTFLLVTQTTLSSEVIGHACLMRTKEIPRIVREAKNNLLAPGKPRPAKVVVETAIKQNLGSIAWYRNGLASQIGNHCPKEELAAACRDAVTALQEYQKFLQAELLPQATGEWRLGRERFATKLGLDLESPMTAEDVSKAAKAEFARVLAEMAEISVKLWPSLHDTEPANPAFSALSRVEMIRKVIEKVSKDKVAVDGLVAEALKASKELKDFIQQKKILDLPMPDRCDILVMPEFQRGNSVAYLNNAPPLDKDARSVYAISPPPADWDSRRVDTFLQEYNRRMMKILTLHEAYPGHYVQLEYGNRNPSLVRKVLSSGVYIEGWAVHMEQVLLDEGFGGGDPALKLLQLKWYLRAVGNALLDQGMHCDGWSDDRALRFLVDECFQSEAEAVGKIIRSKQSSCQLSTYFVGRMAMHQLRESTQKRLGNRFDLRRYHHAVLDLGAVPVRRLPELIMESLPDKPRS